MDDSATMETVRESQLGAALTILYFMVESGRQQVKKDGDNSIRRAFGRRGNASTSTIADKNPTQLILNLGCCSI